MGRLDARTIASVAAARAGPPVSSFLYDAATQRALVLAHPNSINFPAGFGSGTVRQARAMGSWAAVVAVLAGPRVLCLGDDVLLEHLAAVPEVLRMLGAEEGVVAGLACLEEEVLVALAVKVGEAALAAA